MMDVDREKNYSCGGFDYLVQNCRPREENRIQGQQEYNEQFKQREEPNNL